MSFPSAGLYGLFSDCGPCHDLICLAFFRVIPASGNAHKQECHIVALKFVDTVGRADKKSVCGNLCIPYYGIGSRRVKVAIIGAGFGQYAVAPVYRKLGFEVEVVSFEEKLPTPEQIDAFFGPGQRKAEAFDRTDQMALKANFAALVDFWQSH